MAKLAQWEKREILDMLKSDRAKERCELVKKFKSESMELTKDINKKISAVQDKIDGLIEIRTKMLVDGRYTNLNPNQYSCDTSSEHPVLLEFDNETKYIIRQIIKGE